MRRYAITPVLLATIAFLAPTAYGCDDDFEGGGGAAGTSGRAGRAGASGGGGRAGGGGAGGSGAGGGGGRAGGGEAGGGEAGGGEAGGGEAGGGEAGAAGAPPGTLFTQATIDVDAVTITGTPSADVAFAFDDADAVAASFRLTPFGSTPAIGQPSGPPGTVKLSELSALTFLPDDGTPAPGALRVTVPFSTADEQTDTLHAFDGNVDLTGGRATAKVRLVAGGRNDPACPVRAWLYVTATASFAFASGPRTALRQGEWVDLEFDVAAPAVGAPPVLTEVNQFGIQYSTSACADF